MCMCVYVYMCRCVYVYMDVCAYRYMPAHLGKRFRFIMIVVVILRPTVDSKSLGMDVGCFFGLGFEDSHIPTFSLLLQAWQMVG